MILKKIRKELERLKKRLFYSGKRYKQLERMQYELDNLPYEIYDKVKRGSVDIQIPIIKSIEETLDKIIRDKCSLSRFGDGEIGVMNGSRIHYQDRSPELAQRLKEVLTSDIPNLLVGLPPCFGSLDGLIPSTIDFWRKWMFKKRQMTYSVLDMNRVYYNAFFNRCYLNFNRTDEYHQTCCRYFRRLKEIWEDRDVVICESQEARLGVADDLLEGAKSISRIIFCPVKNAFNKYDEILSAFDGINSDVLILAALGPTATVLAYDLCKRGYQAVDIGMIGEEYECFLRKEVGLGTPLKFKYVDSGSEGRKVQRIEDPEYKKQIIKKIL